MRGLLAVLSSGIKEGFSIDAVAKAIASSPNESAFPTSYAGISMYLGAQLRMNEIHQQLFRTAHWFVVRQSRIDFQVPTLSITQDEKGESSGEPARQSISHSVAASLPPAIALMRGLVSTPQGSSSTLTSIPDRLAEHDRFVLMANGSLDQVQKAKRNCPITQNTLQRHFSVLWLKAC